MKSVVVPKHAGGRPTGYDPKTHPHLAELLASRGATVAEFADAAGVTDRTVRNWFAAYPEFAEAFKVNAAAFDERVERALVERALGYEMDSEEIRVVNGEIVRVPARKHFPPDVSACIFWLKNRMPHKYKEVVEQHHGVVEIRSSAEIRKEIESKILEFQAAGLIDITPRQEEDGKRRVEDTITKKK
jgi:transcriptional regulator with XRE-family HTH domain